MAQEFTYTFGGCTIIRGLDGSLFSQAGLQIQDRINLIYTDTPYDFEENFEIISAYAEKLKAAVDTALEEEAVLITGSEDLSCRMIPVMPRPTTACTRPRLVISHR